MNKIREGRKSKSAHKFEDNYGKKMIKVCKDCKMPKVECNCESIKEKAKKFKKELKESFYIRTIDHMGGSDDRQAWGIQPDLSRSAYNKLTQAFKNSKGKVTSEVISIVGNSEFGDWLKSVKGKTLVSAYLGGINVDQIAIGNKQDIERKTMSKLRESIRKLVYEVIAEASTTQIEQLIGKEAAIKYRKATGEVKTYFGRITKMSGENFYMGVLGKGLRAFKAANVLDVRPVSTEMFSDKQRTELDEMCQSKKQEKSIKESGRNIPKCFLHHYQGYTIVDKPFTIEVEKDGKPINNFSSIKAAKIWIDRKTRSQKDEGGPGSGKKSTGKINWPIQPDYRAKPTSKTKPKINWSGSKTPPGHGYEGGPKGRADKK